MSASSSTRQRLRAIGIVTLAYLLFALLDSSAKWLAASHDVVTIIWARYTGHLALSLMLFRPNEPVSVMRSHAPGLQLARSGLLFLSTLCNFIAVRHLPLAVTASIIFTMPLMVALLAGPLLGERVGKERIAASLVALIGVLLVIRPGSDGVHWAMILSLATALFGALYAIATRKLAAIDSSATSFFWTAVVGTVATTPLMPATWTTPGLGDGLLLAAIPFLGGIGHLFIILGHRDAPAAVLAPFAYTQILWMVGLGFILFGDVPDLWTLAGAAIVAGSGVFLVLRERADRER